MEPKPSTSWANENNEQPRGAWSICDEEEPWQPQREETSMNISTSPREDSEQEAEIGKTRPAKVKTAKQSKTTKKKLNTEEKEGKRKPRKKFIINQKRSEIAKRNYIFMKKDERGRWAGKAEEQLKRKPIVLISRLTPEQMPANKTQLSESTIQQSAMQEKASENEKAGPKIISMIVVPPSTTDTNEVVNQPEQHSQEVTQKIKLILQDGTEVDCLQMPDGTLIMDDDGSANETATTEELVQDTTWQKIPVANEETVGPDEPDQQNDHRQTVQLLDKPDQIDYQTETPQLPDVTRTDETPDNNNFNNHSKDTENDNTET